MTKDVLIRLLQLSEEVQEILRKEVRALPVEDQLEYYCLSGSKLFIIQLYYNHMKETPEKSGKLADAKEAIDLVWEEPNRLGLLRDLFGFN